MLSYIDNHYGKRPSFNEGERHELEYLRKAIPEMKKELGFEEPGESTASDKKNEISSEDSYGEEDDGVDKLPMPQVAAHANVGRARMSVSAEVFGNFNK